MKLIMIIVDEITSRLLMIVLGILVMILGLYSPDRVIYALYHFQDQWEKNKTHKRC